ncbi:MAG: OsmC family protein [Alphaproteobacteria bacterium]|nr:OsmC family protein [Alphaproteobacteria bacterium]
MTIETAISETVINETPTTINGVDVDALQGVIDGVSEDASLAACQFRAKNDWITCGHNRSTIQGFYAGGGEDETRTTPFVLDNDEPPILAGSDKGANPVEYVLHALAGCVTTTLVYHAAVRGIEVRAVSSALEGDLDIRGLLGVSDEVRKGFHHVRVVVRVDADAPAEELRTLCKFSPVYDIVSNSLPVDLVVEKL